MGLLLSFSFKRVSKFTEEETVWYLVFAISYYTFHVNKIQQDATVFKYLFTANLLYIFRVSIAPIIRST